MSDVAHYHVTQTFETFYWRDEMLKHTILATLVLAASATAGFAQNAETNKQAPAPQGTVAPESNRKAQQPGPPPEAVAPSEEEANTQTPAKSEPTDLSRKSEQPAPVPGGNSTEERNTTAPAPNNTEAQK